MIPAGGLLEVVSVSANDAGSYDAVFASDLPFGSYYVQERTTNSAYVLYNTEYPVIFEYACQNTALVSIAVNNGEAIYNTYQARERSTANRGRQFHFPV